MMKRNASSQDDRPSLIAELIIPVASIAYAIYYVGSIWNFPQHTQTSGRFLAGILLVFSVLCILKIIIKSLKGSYKLSLGDSFGPQETMLKRAGFFV
nr:hypothetical protein [Halomonas socia]